MIIRGIYNVKLSDSSKVAIFPDRGIITVKKNRDLLFNGQISAGGGRLNLFGKDLYFHYDEFKVDLNHIDSVQLSVPVQPIQKDMYGNEILTPIKLKSFSILLAVCLIKFTELYQYFFLNMMDL